MGIEYDDLPLWEFSVSEVAAGVYRVRAVRDGRITGETTSTDPDDALQELKHWAQQIDDERTGDDAPSNTG